MNKKEMERVLIGQTIESVEWDDVKEDAVLGFTLGNGHYIELSASDYDNIVFLEVQLATIKEQNTD